MVETVNKNDGGRDLSTPAEQALRPGAPESRTPPSTSNLKFGTTLGAVTTAAALSGATFASIKGALNAKKSLGTLTSSLTSAAADFDTTSNRLLSGQTYLKDTSVFGMDSTAKVSDGGFYSASDLVQFSSMKPGKAIAGTAAAAAVAIQLAQRKERLLNMVTRFSVSLSNFSIFGPVIKENYNRSAYPNADDVGRPSVSRTAEGGDAAKNDPVIKDKRKTTVKGAAVAAGKPSVWSRLTTSVTDAIKGYRLQPGFNATLNMVFSDKKHQKAWSEPSTPYAAQSPYNKATQTESGHVIEYDDTPGAERIHFFHRSGSFIEMHPNGKVVYKSMNHGYLISMADQNISVKGACNISVDGDANIYAKGEMNLQSDRDINIRTKKDFNVYAMNVNLRAKKNAKLDGLEIDLRYVTLPGKPVFTSNGIAPRLNRAALKQDFPETEKQVADKEREWDGQINALKQNVIKTLLPKVVSTSAAMTAPVGGGPIIGGTAMAAAIGDAAKTTLQMISVLRGGPFPPTGDTPVFAFPPVSPEQEPLDNPLGNPLAYIAKTQAAVNYRTLFFDTPEEMGDAEQYQAHLVTRQALGDIASVEPQLGGKHTTPATGIVGPTSLPLVNYLDRDTYRGNFSADPGQTLGGTSFTYGELVDSLARPDVANPIVTETPTA